MTHAGERMGVPRGALGFSPCGFSLSPSLAVRKTGRRAPLGTPILSSNAMLLPTRAALTTYTGANVALVQQKRGC
jgi:hypothetical protein